MGLSYTWDSVTNTIFLNSDATYQWLISTPEHQEGKAIKQTWDAVQGWWLNYNDMEYMSHHSENICFYPDCTFYYRTWRIKGYGTYRVTRPNIIEVNYDIYFNGAGTTTYGYDYSTSDTYQLSGNRLNGDFQRVSGYCYPNGEQ